MKEKFLAVSMDGITSDIEISMEIGGDTLTIATNFRDDSGFNKSVTLSPTA